MRLKILERDIWIACAVVEVEGEDGPLCCIETYQGDRATDLAGIVALVEVSVSQPQGPKGLGNSLCHEVSNEGEPKIFEFIKGKLRLLWFYGDGEKLIVCSHVLRKKSQKTPRGDVEKALAIREEYFRACARGAVEYLEE